MLPSDPSRVASEIELILGALNRADLGSEAALDLIGQAVIKITDFARDHIDQALPEMGDITEDNNLEFQRQAAAALRPLLLSYGFYGQLAREILRGMWSLENGVTSPALKARPRPGSRFSIEMREKIPRLVNLADFVKKIVVNTEAYKDELKSCGVNESSIRGYKKELGLFSTDKVEDPYRAENILLIASGQPSLTSDQKLKMAKDEISAIKTAIDKHLIINSKRNLS